MKKIIIMWVVIIMSITGCTLNENTSLEDYYGELISKPFNEISLEEVKKDLENFEYEKQKDVTDLSFNKFKDEQGNFIDIELNEKNNEISGFIYSKVEEDTTINMVCGQTFSNIFISGSNIEKQKEVMENLNLDENSNKVIGSYFEIANNLYNKKGMHIDDIKNILKTNYKKINEKDNTEDVSEYAFVPEDTKGLDVVVKTKEIGITNIDLHIDLDENSRYRLILSATNENEIDKKSPFILKTNIILNEINNSGEVDKDALAKSSKELFDFIFKDKNLDIEG